MRRLPLLVSLAALIALLAIPGTAAATDRPWWTDQLGDGPCTLEAIIVEDLVVQDGSLVARDLVLQWATREGYALTPDGVVAPDGSVTPVPRQVTLGRCATEVVPGLAVLVSGAVRGGGWEPAPGGGTGTVIVVAGPIETPEEAWKAVVAFDPRFAGIGPLDPDIIGASAWYEIASTRDLPVSRYFITVTIGWGDCQAGCIERHVWQFTVTRDGEVSLDGEKGPGVPPDQLPPGWSEDCVPPGGGIDDPSRPGECVTLVDPKPGAPVGGESSLDRAAADIFAGPWGVLLATLAAGVAVLGLAVVAATRLGRKPGSPDA